MAIVRKWRAMTSPGGGRARRLGPGAPTLVACSGGADSMALALVLRSATARLIVGHVVHDLRPRSQALADRDAARSLADRLGAPFVEAEVRVRATERHGQTNIEALARRERYAALRQMAVRSGVRFVAVAHHADDQLENLLMSLVRGGIVRGMPPSRRLGDGITLLRPMLCEDHEVTREHCRRLCELADISWCEDATNADTSRLRAAIRSTVLPTLKSLRSDVARHAVQASADAAAARRVVADAARACIACARREPDSLTWKRADLERAPLIVLGEAIRAARAELIGPSGADKLSKRAIDRAARAICDDSTEPRTIQLADLMLDVHAAFVRVTATPSPASKTKS